MERGIFENLPDLRSDGGRSFLPPGLGHQKTQPRGRPHCSPFPLPATSQNPPAPLAGDCQEKAGGEGSSMKDHPPGSAGSGPAVWGEHWTWSRQPGVPGTLWASLNLSFLVCKMETTARLTL